MNEDFIKIQADSSCISSFQYSKEKHILIVNFKHGGNFIYGDIEEELVDKLIKAKSKGQFYNKYIRRLR